MWKNLGKSVLFITIFAMLFLGISPVFVPKNNTDSAGIHAENAKGFLGEAADTMDVLFVGDSEAYSSFIPLRIWEQYGITSYVCSNGDQLPYQCWSYLDWFFRSQSPKVVVLETNTLYREYTLAQLLSHCAEEVFPYLRYHDRWKNLRPEDWGSPVQYTETVRDKGYIYKTETTFTDTEGFMTPSEEAEPVPMLSQAFARLIRDDCRKQGAELILVSTPSPTNWSSYYHNGVQQLAQELGVTYIDLNLMPQEVPIDWSRDSYDSGDHLNYEGACKVTDYMGALLWDMGLFADKRKAVEYASWNEDLMYFMQALNG